MLILWPSYDNFRSTVEAAGADVVYSELGSDFTFDPNVFEQDIVKERPKLAYICNPNNPTGTLILKDQIQKLIAENPETMFLIDEAYAEFSGQSVNDLALAYDNILVTHTMSKAFGLANIRFGYLVSSVNNIDAINRIRNSKNIQTISQVAVISALENAEYMRQYVEEVIQARKWFDQALSDVEFPDIVKIYPSKSNFILIRCKDINTRNKICYSLREERIYVRQLSQCTSVLDCIRITIGTRKQMETVYHVICRAMNKTEGKND